jgi:hypothetical protein
MSNQLQLTGGAKVRNLQDVIIGTSGVLSSVAFDVANGVPRLDVNGKILVSQLPNSVMEYKGTWNAATNTPTLVNGVGNQGDVYLVEGAAVGGTAFNFGAGPITFFNGDQVIYSGSIWQRASGSTGTVTSVAVTESGDSLNITGSPITTSGTINIGFNGTNLQYVNGAGNLTTFPDLSVYVTLAGTQTITGAKTFGIAKFDGGIYLKDSAITSIISGYTAIGSVTGGIYISLNGSIYQSTLAFNSAADFTYQFPSASGTIALTSDIPSLTGYVPYTGATANVDLGTFNLTADIITGSKGSFASNGGSDTFAINHSSGAGIALNITKGGNGEGLYINKTSGSGNAVTIIGTLNATTLVKSGGTSAQFLKADGSVDSSTYLTTSAAASTYQTILTNPVTGTGTTNYLPKFTGTSTIGNSLIQDDGTTVSITRTAGDLELSLWAGSTTVAGNSILGLYAGTGLGNLIPYGTIKVIPETATNTRAANMVFSTRQSGGTLTESFRIFSTQNIGIGTTTDSGYKLDVNGTGRFSGALSGSSATFSGNGAFSGVLQVAPTTGTGIIGVGDNFGGGMNAGIYRGGLGVTTAGNYLNIGGYDGVVITTGNAALGSQTVRLTIASTGAATFSSDVNTSTKFKGRTSGSGVAFETTNAVDADFTIETVSGGTTKIGTSGNKLAINSGGGNVLIGTSTDAGYKLDVNGTGRFSGNIQVGGSAISGNSSSFYNTASETSVGIKQTSGATSLALALWNNSTTGDSRFLRFFTEATATYRGAIQYDRAGDRLGIYGGGSGLFFDGAATFSSSVTATSFFESSSIKGKDIIATNPLLALDIDVIKYTRKSDESKDIRYGYSAEQIHSLMPELTDKDVTAVKYLDVHTILISQLQKEIKELKAKIN